MQPIIKHTEVNGITMEYIDIPQENAPVVVFLHGLCSTKELFDRMLPDFAGKYRVLSLDLRGHGETTRRGPYTFDQLIDDLLAWMDAEGLEKVSFAAGSFSTAPAQMFAVRYPERVEKLILLDGGFYPLSERPGFSRDTVLNHTKLPSYATEAEVLQHVDNVYGDLSSDAIRSLAKLEFEQKADGSYGYKLPLEAFQGYFLNLADTDYDSIYPHLKTPVLLLLADVNRRAADQKEFYQKAAQTFAERVPHARVVMIPNSLHALMLTNPRECSELSLAFLAEK